ncbi:class I SAM-dependent methyltransferase [Curvivirga sp.]|uniref:class I SAM-dependent methyltransferase n=1 Tax=Curvivirga sp. TaxID=2856848 RepID=UPI003B5B7ADE
MIVFPNERESFLELIPKEGIGCEIGVAECVFSQHLLEKTQPTKLHLIDPWVYQEREDYQADLNNVSNDEGEKRYQAARTLFKNQMDTGQVEIHRNFSYETVSHFPDNYFDWIYVDAVHSYEGAKKDLEDFLPKLKDDGILMGHDYANHIAAQEMGFGVVEAVDDFCIENNMNFVALTYDAFPTFILTKPENKKVAEYLTLVTKFNFPEAIEIVDYPKHNKLQMDILDFKTEKRLSYKFLHRE